jgi:hypothetical protein
MHYDIGLLAGVVAVSCFIFAVLMVIGLWMGD